MKARFSKFLMLTVLMALPRLASAQVTPAAGYTPPDDTPVIRVGATMFLNYSFTQTPKATDTDSNTISTNSFDSPRAYINITGNINHAISFRITPDVFRNSGANTSNVYRTKYAYAQFSLDDWTGDWKQTWVRLGIQQTPWLDGQESIYRYRFQGTLFSERIGKLTSSDAGFSFHTNFPKNYGDFHVGVYNGEGYSTVEANNQKALQVRVSIRPLPTGALVARGLRFHVFYDGDNVLQNAERMRTIIGGTFEHAKINLGAEYMKAGDQLNKAAADVKSKGFSIWATPIFKTKGDGPELLFRYDSYTPNNTATAVKQNRLIAGFAYWFPHQGTVTTCLMFDVDQVKFPGATTPTQRVIFVHGLINF